MDNLLLFFNHRDKECYGSLRHFMLERKGHSFEQLTDDLRGKFGHNESCIEELRRIFKASNNNIEQVMRRTDVVLSQSNFNTRLRDNGIDSLNVGQKLITSDYDCIRGQE